MHGSDVLHVMSWAHPLCGCAATLGDCFLSPGLEIIHPVEIGRLYSLLFCMELCLFAAVQTQRQRHWVRAGIKMTQNQDCSSNIEALPFCMQWVNVAVPPGCYLHWYHCLMDYFLSTQCWKRVRNTSLYKFKINCFSCQWPCLFYFQGMRVWKGSENRFQTLLKKTESASILLDHTLTPLTVVIAADFRRFSTNYILISGCHR